MHVFDLRMWFMSIVQLININDNFSLKQRNVLVKIFLKFDKPAMTFFNDIVLV